MKIIANNFGVHYSTVNRSEKRRKQVSYVSMQDLSRPDPLFPQLIVLYNMNSYLGGGETLMVRFASYLNLNKINFLAVCSEDSFISSNLRKLEISFNYIKTISLSPDYYYHDQEERSQLIQKIKDSIPNNTKIKMVTFCMRDLYTAFALSREIENISITHLVLHVQDDLYIGQTLFDKAIYKITKKRFFSNIKLIRFNRRILSLVNSKSALIVMADLIARYWEKNFPMKINKSQVVPLPSFSLGNEMRGTTENSKSILWIGRVVDFKIPSLVAMVEFVCENKEYTLTIVGDGDVLQLMRHIRKKKLDCSRIHFLGEIPYSGLKEVIENHSIGYAMGTSLIELAKYKLPVIIALASYDHKLFTRQICGGLFFNKPKGCDGSDLVLIKQNDIKSTISESIRAIEENYHVIAEECFEYARNQYSIDHNFSKYIDIINNSNEFSNCDKDIRIPMSPAFRRKLFKTINRKSTSL